MASIFSLLLIPFFYALGKSQQLPYDSITPGSSLSTTTNLSWPSSSSLFSFGFYKQDNGFAVGIWLMRLVDSPVIVWTANRDDPLITSNATLSLNKDGLVLVTMEGIEKQIAKTSESAAFAYMLDSGNFVLCNRDYDVIWGSFSHPTDTILGGQSLPSGGELFSSQSQTNRSTGRFTLVMQLDGNLVLYPVNTGNKPRDSYWSSSTFSWKGISNNYLYLNTTGDLFIINATSSRTIKSYGRRSSFTSDGRSFTPISNNYVNGSNTIYRATLDVDGVFRLYLHTTNERGEPVVSTLWSALENACEVHSFCGFNSFCTFNDNVPYCQCLPGTDFIDPSQPLVGCERNFSRAECRSGKENAAFYNITDMKNMMWGDRAYYEVDMSIEDCRASCLEDCNCGAALFKDYRCKKQKLPLRYIRRDQKESSIGLVKVGSEGIKIQNTADLKKPKVVTVTSKTTVVLILVITLGCTVLSIIFLTIAGVYLHKFRVLKYERLLENGNSGLAKELTLRLFSYNDLRKATDGFKEELGRGSFGAVYRGSLSKGKELVAVKRLEKLIDEGEREFQAEMRTIGRAHHKNLVRLLGYCAEDSKRLLVYEYMTNGSLANLIFKAERRPDWNERVRIAIEIAKGILYLHEECESPIIHCDIKPQNILMDDNWNAKIADFGLAKLLMPDQTRTFTGARGTRGYSAPEWDKNTPISLKVDVYSYGILLLETICCRRNIEVNVTDPEKIVLSAWVYKCFVDGEVMRIMNGEEVDKKTFKNMVKIALWCIQDEPALRPSMKSVVLMLEGITDISVPPCPTVYTFLQ